MPDKAPLRIVLIEDDPVECDRMRNYIDDIDGVRLVGVANNSADGLELTRSLLPSAVILDLELKSGSGLAFLNDLRHLVDVPKPYVLVCSNNSSSMTYEAARDLGMDYFISKHQPDYSPKTIINFLSLVAAHTRNSNLSDAGFVSPPEERKSRLRNRIRKELDLVCISRKSKGYDLLTDAIQLSIESGDTAKITGRVAAEHNQVESRVERAMHDAIKAAWGKAAPDDLLDNYPAPVSSRTGVPTLLEFISTYARKVGDDYS